MNGLWKKKLAAWLHDPAEKALVLMRDDVGHDPAHPTICGRCTSNLYGAGEHRTCA